MPALESRHVQTSLLAVVLIASGAIGCNVPVQVPPSPFGDTADLPPTVAPGPINVPPETVLVGPGWTILLDIFSVLSLVHQPIMPGGSFPGGDRQVSDGQIQIHLVGTGSLAGWQRTIIIPLHCEIHAGVRPYGASTQSFPTTVFVLHGQIGGDTDFDLLQITAGDAFGLPSPGHTTLTRLPGGNWNVDSFFDVTYRIDYIGTPFGALQGQSGQQTRSVHIQIGQPPAPPGTWTEQGDAPDLMPGQTTSGTGPLNTVSGSLSGTGDVDAYCIRIDDPLQFAASTQGGASFDTQIFLFDAGGMGVTHNDDAPTGGTQSRITGQFVPGPGFYVLAISAYNRDAFNPVNLPIWNNVPFNVERPPDGPGAPGPLDHWQPLALSSGAYTIQLTGCRFCAAPQPPIPPGNDLWSVDDPPNIQFGGPDIPPIPADFFSPGSQPFSGIVLFGGKAFAPGIGDADTLVRRMDSCDVPSPGSTATIPIEILSLDLRSVDPIVVSGNQWKIAVQVPPPQPTGTMTITRDSADGGTFTASLPVRPVFVFTPVGGGPDRSWDPGVVVTLTSQGSAAWVSLPPPYAQPGGGPQFFPAAPLGLGSASVAMTVKPAVALPPERWCGPLDVNQDRHGDGVDIQGIVEALLTGPSHPRFCSVDANANGVADNDDLDRILHALLNWPTPTFFGSDYWDVDYLSGCDYGRRVIVSCIPGSGTVRRAVRGGDTQGNASTCPVRFQLRNCDGVDIGTPTPVGPNATECVEVPDDRELVLWCEPAPGGECRISMKSVPACP